MSLFEEAVAMVLRYEGGETNDPQDPGKRTKYGISSKTHPGVDLDTLTREGAMEIYRTEYWDTCQCDALPGQVAIILFDSAVNQGVPTAIRLLQREVQVTQDGVMGAQTLEAVRARIHDDLAARLTARRAVAYAQMPKSLFERFGFGWMVRTVDAYRTAVVHG